MLDYNVPLGKLNRGMAVLDVVRSVRGAAGVGSGEEFQARVLGWCIEFLQAYFLVADDIMDRSQTRRGQSCWYLREGVGMVAINDGIILESCIYRLLRSHLREHASYLPLLELFLDTTYRTAHGQLLDTTNTPVGRVDLARYSQDMYDRIVTYKTSYYTFYLPVAAGLLLCGERRVDALALAERICVQLGRYFQIQDDVLDVYGDPEVIGKVGTDIQDNKCSWLVVQALQRATDDQRAVLEANYGRDDPHAIAAVRALYDDLALQAAFEEYETQSYNDLNAAIDEQTLLPPCVFRALLQKIYKRIK